MLLQKKEMTRVFVDGKMIPVTLLKLMPQKVIRHKTQESDGYVAVIVWTRENDKKQESKKYADIFEVRNADLESFPIDTDINMSILDDVASVTIKSVSKWKGFQGMIKRCWASGMPATHGHKFTRVWWSKGNRKPRRVLKWHPEAWHMGDEKMTLSSVPVVKVYTFENETLVALKGSVPWGYNSFVKVLVK